MYIVKDGQIIYNSVDNTGATNDASLGARYAKGRLDTLEGRFDGYYTKAEVVDLLTGVAETRIVSAVPEAPSANTYYLVGNDSEGYTLHYYDSNFVHAIVGSYEIDLSGASPQRNELPTATEALSGKVYQYTGTTQSKYVRGKWYVCGTQEYYGWLNIATAKTYYTDSVTPSAGDYIYDEDGALYSYTVASEDGNTMVDSNGDSWTRNSIADNTQWQWNDLADGALTEVWNHNLVANRTLVSDTHGKIVASGVSTEELSCLSGVTSNIQNQLQNLDTTNLKSSAIATSINVNTPFDTKLSTEKAVRDYAVQKTTGENKIYGTGASGVATNYGLTTSISSTSTAAQIPTAKSIYDYAVPRTTDASRIYGTNSASTATNYALVTSITSLSTDAQIPTAKSIHNFAVQKTTTGSRLYGTDSSGAAHLYPISDSYDSNAVGQIASRTGLFSAYSKLKALIKKQSKMVGIFNRTSAMSTTGASWKNITLLSSNDLDTDYVYLSNNGIMIVRAGIYKFTVTVRLADTTPGTWVAWAVGLTNHDDDQNGGEWRNSDQRHKITAVFTNYYAANTRVYPRICVTNLFPNMQTCNVVVECVKES